MKIAVFGSKSVTNINIIVKAIQLSGFQPTQIYVGSLRFMDKLTIKLAHINNIPCQYIKADWNTYGRIANHRRAEDMMMLADAGILIRKGWYRFTQQVIIAAKKTQKPLQVIELDPDDQIIKNYCLNYDRMFH